MTKEITREFLSEKYDELYKRANALHQKYDPCGIKSGRKGVTCKAGRAGKNYTGGSLHHSFFCCDGCQYLGPEGCTVEALRCKFWFCGHLYEEELDQELVREMDKIMNEAWKYGFFVFRGSKEDNLYEACYKFGLLRRLKL